MDAATGLLYVGDGQYYDPSTGRFLTRNAKPNQSNPYLPFDPTGAMLGPLGVLALVLGSKKKKSKADVLLFVLVFAVASGVTLTACGNGETSTQESTFEAVITPVSSNTALASTEVNGTQTPAVLVTVPPNISVEKLLDELCNRGLTPSSIDEEMAQYGVYFTGAIQGWNTSYKHETAKDAIKEAVTTVAKKFAKEIGGSPQSAFKRIYGYINFEWCNNCVANAFGENTDDHTIKFDGMFNWDSYKRVRNIIHELGHMFDRKICANREADGVCNIVGDEIREKSSARTDLQGVWENEEWKCEGKRSCLSRSTDEGPYPGMYWGFAGPRFEWQYGQTDLEGEVWADMFLGWVYNKWDNDLYGYGDTKKRYMNNQMVAYLAVLR